MPLSSLVSWLQNTSLSHAIAKANHLFMAGLQVVHVLGFIFLLAALLLSSLRLLGWALAGQPVAQVARDATRLLWVGLAFTVASGTLMFIGAPTHYASNPAFELKMLLLVIAVITQVTLFRGAAQSTSPVPAKAGVVVGLVFWFGVSLAGRAIGFV
jgi:hypothetical protein